MFLKINLEKASLTFLQSLVVLNSGVSLQVSRYGCRAGHGERTGISSIDCPRFNSWETSIYCPILCHRLVPLNWAFRS